MKAYAILCSHSLGICVISRLCFTFLTMKTYVYLDIVCKGASALGTQCALNVHSIHIDRVRT